MKSKMLRPKNPCFGCPETGCGNHSQCEKYMDFFNRLRELDAQKQREMKVCDYTYDAIQSSKKGDIRDRKLKTYKNRGD